jgi:hypothetical protein
VAKGLFNERVHEAPVVQNTIASRAKQRTAPDSSNALNPHSEFRIPHSFYSPP